MTKKVLLVAEDDENDALLLERALRRAKSDFRMLRVANGEELVDYLESRPPFHDRELHPTPALILLDLKMPRMDGFDVLKWRQDSIPARLVPVVVFASSTLDRDIKKAYALGANSYAVKPMRSDALEGMVRALVGWWGRFHVTGAAAPA